MCQICDRDNYWNWTDTHGVAQCSVCGTAHRIYHYNEKRQRAEKVQAGGDPIPDEVMHGYLMAEDSLLPREDALFKQGVSTANDNPDDWEDLK